MGHESLIMQQSHIGAISHAIKDCLRCGKCKPVCATHVPRANLLYSPRNKILATSLLIEAFLYEEQTRRGISIKHWEEFEDVADHCTVCHKCYNPCPVDIDFGDVSMDMRALLRAHGQEVVQSRHDRGDVLPQRQGSAHHQRHAQGDGRRRLQGAAHRPRLAGRAGAQADRPRRPPPWARRRMREQVVHFINKKMPGGLPKQTARKLLDIEDADYVPIIRNPQRTTAETEAVFYFPGCGSERLFSQVGPGHPGHAVACRRADRAAAGLSVLRLSAARQRHGPTRPRRSSPTTACCSIAWPTR